MHSKRRTVVGLGELLWDIFPTEKKLGGAPANFAYIASLLGDEGLPVSRVGRDDLGSEAILRLTELGLATSFVQEDEFHPTGTVHVEVDPLGQPRFDIAQEVAWDFLELTRDWKVLAEQADAVCFGSLAQRASASRITIRRFLRYTRPTALRVFDVNLRQNFYSKDVIAESVKLATIVKLNHDEFPTILNLLDLENKSDELSARSLIEKYKVRLVCLTRGSNGSLLVTAERCVSHPGFRIEVADTVGAGDAFTAALVHEYMQDASLERMSETANRMGAWVASQFGATPVLKPGGIEKTLAAIG